MNGEYPLEIGEFTFYLPYHLAGSPVVPANFNGHPDSWSPEEGGDLEVIWEPKSNLFFQVLEDLSSKTTVDHFINDLEIEIKNLAKCEFAED